MLLGVEYQKHLVLYLYRMPLHKRYLKFELPKKSGGKRTISVPATQIKTVQRKLSKLLEEIYIPQNPAHGFIKDKSIITNADSHINRKYVLNIDLKDFFGTINFGRVRGMLMKHPYNISPPVATVIAQICCHENVLPQGAPTSPIISNMICNKLDNQLRKLAQRHRCFYTRYADDITFSTNLKEPPINIASFHGEGEALEVIIGDELKQIIIDNDFEINLSKTRLQRRSDRQEVTGLVTNKKRNVNRRFIRNIRAMLFSWETLGVDDATELHYSKNPHHHVPAFKSKPKIDQIIRGRIEFIRSVRGQTFSTYRTLAKKYNTLIPDSGKKLPVPSDSFVDLIKNNVFVIQNDASLFGNPWRQGTAFYLEDINAFVTCNHLLESTGSDDVCNDFWLFNPDNPTKNYPLILIKGEPHPLDIAVFALKEPSDFFADYLDHTPLKLKTPFASPVHQDKITLVGWPKFKPGKSIHIDSGVVCSPMVESAFKKLVISTSIIEGNSGGVILDQNNYVVGVAQRGKNKLNADEVAENIAISADHILSIITPPYSHTNTAESP